MFKCNVDFHYSVLGGYNGTIFAYGQVRSRFTADAIYVTKLDKIKRRFISCYFCCVKSWKLYFNFVIGLIVQVFFCTSSYAAQARYRRSAALTLVTQSEFTDSFK